MLHSPEKPFLIWHGTLWHHTADNASHTNCVLPCLFLHICYPPILPSSSWFHQHQQLVKLNLQAHQSAMARADEFVLEALLTFDKLEVLVHELLAIEAWKQFVLPPLLETERVSSGKCTTRIYFTLYHEATLSNLLEVVMYHKHVCEEAGELLLELVDYCVRKITLLISGDLNQSPPTEDKSPASVVKGLEKMTKRSPKEEIEAYLAETDFRSCVTAVGLLRFQCEHIAVTPLSVMTRVLDTHDVLLGLAALIENPPWTRRSNEGKWEKYVDFKWTNVAPADLLVITKTEGQVWLAMYHLMCQEECRKRYHFNSLRKGSILRVRKFINNVLLDQLPVLASVQRQDGSGYMDELSIMDVPEASSMPVPGGLLMEQVPQIREGLLKGRDWAEMVHQAATGIFNQQDDAEDQDIRSLATLYAGDEVEDLLNPKSC
ncbi:unnamed protein product [Discosporangium mesarthrocarpum]